ncbi:hypothetical protein KIL84_007356 [Mauremys mutica]|uniref:Uncharacterized protein n=1 Tax=Mauremys mutica TaxID=74926 RepID=A0A9D3X312_9SAUR|nr:hypothetical protein KIL84_007356 [Mauremys mutica]
MAVNGEGAAHVPSFIRRGRYEDKRGELFLEFHQHPLERKQNGCENCIMLETQKGLESPRGGTKTSEMNKPDLEPKPCISRERLGAAGGPSNT